MGAKATVVATWTFDSPTDTSNPFDAATRSVNVTSASLNVTSPNGASISAPSGLLVISGTQQKVDASVLTFTLNTSGATFAFSSLTFDYNRADSTKSPNTITWSYTTSGGASGNLGTSALTGTGLKTDGSVILSTVTLPPSQTFTLTGTLSGGTATGSPGDLSFDNFVFNSSVTPIPEPIHLAMGIFGLIFVGTGAGRFYLARLRRA
jgi:hypothetical protein